MDAGARRRRAARLPGGEPRRREADSLTRAVAVREAAFGVTAPGVTARQVTARELLALQRSAGNAAVGRLVQRTAVRGNRRALLQRSPRTWSASNETKTVLELEKGGGKKPYWAEIQRLTRDYGDLGDNETAERARILRELATQIEAWRENQKESWVLKKELVTKKKSALTALERLIVGERRELAQIPTAPAIPAAAQGTAPGPPPPPSGRPPALGPPLPFGPPQPYGFPPSQAFGMPRPQALMPPSPPPRSSVPDEIFALEEDDFGYGERFRGDSDEDEAQWGADPREVKWGAEKPEIKWGAEKRESKRGGEKPEIKWGAEKRESRWGAEKDEFKTGKLDEEFEEKESEASDSPRYPRNMSPPNVRPPSAVKVLVHMTSPDYLPGRKGIHATGLVRGASQGIGQADGPNEGAPDPEHLYTLDLTSRDTTRYVAAESGGEPVVVVTLEEGFPDLNYAESGYGAQMHAADAPPVRGVPPGPRPATPPGTSPPPELWSFTLPMTPQSRQGLANFISRHTAQPVSPDTAVGMVHRVLQDGMPLYIQGKFPRGQ